MTNNDIVPEISEHEFDSFISDGLVLIDFYAEWCMPCMMLAPIIDDFAQKYQGKIKFGKVNVGENEAIAKKFNISSIPNLLLFNNKEIVENFIGSIPEDELEKALDSHL